MCLTLNQSSTVVWAFGQLGIRSPRFWHQLTASFPALRCTDGFAAPNAVVVRLLWGMASAGHRNVAILRNVAAWMNNGVQLKLCRSDHVAPIIRSFAILQYSPGQCSQSTKYISCRPPYQAVLLSGSSTLLAALRDCVQERMSFRQPLNSYGSKQCTAIKDRPS